MGPFDHIQRKGSKAIKPEPARIRKEVVSNVSSRWKPSIPVTQQSNKQGSLRLTKAGVKDAANLHVSSSKLRAQNPRKRSQQSQPYLESDSDSECSEDTGAFSSRKRPKILSHVEQYTHRQVRSHKAFSVTSARTLEMVHAAKIAGLHKPTKYRAAFPAITKAPRVLLQYPSVSEKEKYELVIPIQKDDFKPLEDIKEVLDVITTHYLPEAIGQVLKDENCGLLRKLKRAADRLAGDEYIELIKEWNNLIVNFRDNGTISKILDGLHRLDLRLIERILIQTYSRTVSLHVRELSQYENGTDNVYGELLPKFISTILNKDTKLKSNQIFVDLGSGVGNVVLQAALEIGCQSWGCEIMEKASTIAELQEKEFRSRCNLWGLSAGEVHLEKGDFLKNPVIGSVLRKADVVLVNNQAFTPELNENLISLFLDLKEGSQIVSLKSFVPSGHKITPRNLDSAYNVLNVVEKRYYSACVSWTDAPGTYYVSTKDRSRLLAVAKER